MDVLAIGNSFSQDANKYFREVAAAAGVNVFNANLFIGGCPLELHFRNMKADAEAYLLEIAGIGTGFYTSIKKALLSRPWSVVTVQQSSPSSPKLESYSPYGDELVKYIRELCPKAKIYVHQTWAYDDASPRIQALGFENRAAMFAAIKSSYSAFAEKVGADGIIPSGEALEKLTALGAEKVHRDMHHTDLGIGRYTLALTWLETLTGVSAIGNSFRGFAVPLTEAEVEMAQNAAHEACALYNK